MRGGAARASLTTRAGHHLQAGAEGRAQPPGRSCLPARVRVGGGRCRTGRAPGRWAEHRPRGRRPARGRCACRPRGAQVRRPRRRGPGRHLRRALGADGPLRGCPARARDPTGRAGLRPRTAPRRAVRRRPRRPQDGGGRLAALPRLRARARPRANADRRRRRPRHDAGALPAQGGTDQGELPGLRHVIGIGTGERRGRGCARHGRAPRRRRARRPRRGHHPRGPRAPSLHQRDHGHAQGGAPRPRRRRRAPGHRPLRARPPSPRISSGARPTRAG